MRKNLVFGLIVTLVLSMTGPGALARAEEKKKAENAEKAEKEGVWRPFQIAIFNPVQIFNAKTTIKGFRLNLPYGRNKEVYGIDLGFVNRVDENFSSWQMGFVNLVGGRSSGLQMGLYNSSKELKGIQLGLLNTAREMKGLQLGLINDAGTMRGLQLGLIYNSADKPHGLQLGPMNFNWSRKPITFFPIINGSF